MSRIERKIATLREAANDLHDRVADIISAAEVMGRVCAAANELERTSLSPAPRRVHGSGEPPWSARPQSSRWGTPSTIGARWWAATSRTIAAALGRDQHESSQRKEIAPQRTPSAAASASGSLPPAAYSAAPPSSSARRRPQSESPKNSDSHLSEGGWTVQGARSGEYVDVRDGARPPGDSEMEIGAPPLQAPPLSAPPGPPGPPHRSSPDKPGRRRPRRSSRRTPCRT